MKQQKQLQAPLNLDFFEQVLLYNALTDSDYLSSIAAHLSPSFFTDRNIGLVISKIVSFFQERGSVPTVTELKARLVAEEDKVALKHVKGILTSIDNSFNREELLKNTERFLKERMIYKVILNVAETVGKEGIDAEQLLVDFETAYNVSLHENLGHWYFKDYEKHIQELTAVYRPIPTGWKFFDSKTEGGLFPKTLVVFAGQVNIGKSIVLGNIATNMVLADKNVLLISLEMSEHIYAKRISTQLTQIPHSDLKLFPNELKEQIEHIKKKISGNLIIKEYPPKTITVRQIDSYINKLRHKGFIPDVVVVDYINLLLPTTKNLNTYSEVKELSEQLRALSVKYNLPVVSATQLNRDGFHTSSPGMEKIAESIGLAATADVICSLWQDDEDRELGVINMGMQKNRFGPNFGHAAFKCNYDTLTLKETDPDYFAPDPSTKDEVRTISAALTTDENE